MNDKVIKVLSYVCDTFKIYSHILSKDIKINITYKFKIDSWGKSCNSHLFEYEYSQTVLINS